MEGQITLFKYKSTNNISYLSELICGQKLNCSLLDDLNDPWEGRFIYNYPKDEKANGITETKIITETKSIYDFINEKRMRISALSSDYKSRLMWSYYADSFKGICIEIDFPDELISLRKPKINYINKVKYKGFFSYNGSKINEQYEIVNQKPSDYILLKILTNKTKEWKHEKEYRLITYDEKFNIQGMIKKIYIGDRADENTKIAIKKMADKIPVYWLKIRNNWNIKNAISTWEEEYI
jgi:hypothetical protein